MQKINLYCHQFLNPDLEQEKRTKIKTIQLKDMTKMSFQIINPPKISNLKKKKRKMKREKLIILMQKIKISLQKIHKIKKTKTKRQMKVKNPKEMP